MLKSLDNCGDDEIHLILKIENYLYTIGKFQRSRTEERFSNDFNLIFFHITSSKVSIKQTYFYY